MECTFKYLQGGIYHCLFNHRTFCIFDPRVVGLEADVIALQIYIYSFFKNKTSYKKRMDFKQIFNTSKPILISVLTTIVITKFANQLSLIKSPIDVHLLSILFCFLLFLLMPIVILMLNKVFDYGLGLKSTLQWGVLALVSAIFAIMFRFFQTTPTVSSHTETEILIGMIAMLIVGYGFFMMFYNALQFYFKVFKFERRITYKTVPAKEN